MSSWHTRLASSLLVVVIAGYPLLILRKKGKVKHNRPAVIGLFTITFAIFKLIVRLAQGRLNHTNFLIYILLFAAGAVIFGIWGINRKSIDTKQN